MLPTNIKHKLLSRIVTLFILAILTASILIPAAIRADDCRSKVAAVGCKFGLPTDQYDALLPQIQAQSAPFGQAIPVASDDLDTYAQHAANGTVLKMPSSLTGVLMDA